MLVCDRMCQLVAMVHAKHGKSTIEAVRRDRLRRLSQGDYHRDPERSEHQGRCFRPLGYRKRDSVASIMIKAATSKPMPVLSFLEGEGRDAASIMIKAQPQSQCQCSHFSKVRGEGRAVDWRDFWPSMIRNSNGVMISFKWPISVGRLAVFSEELTSSKDKRRKSPKPKRRENSKVAFQLLNGRQKR